MQIVHWMVTFCYIYGYNCNSRLNNFFHRIFPQSFFDIFQQEDRRQKIVEAFKPCEINTQARNNAELNTKNSKDNKSDALSNPVIDKNQNQIDFDEIKANLLNSQTKKNLISTLGEMLSMIRHQTDELRNLVSNHRPEASQDVIKRESAKKKVYDDSKPARIIKHKGSDQNNNLDIKPVYRTISESQQISYKSKNEPDFHEKDSNFNYRHDKHNFSEKCLSSTIKNTCPDSEISTVRSQSDLSRDKSEKFSLLCSIDYPSPKIKISDSDDSTPGYLDSCQYSSTSSENIRLDHNEVSNAGLKHKQTEIIEKDTDSKHSTQLKESNSEILRNFQQNQYNYNEVKNQENKNYIQDENIPIGDGQKELLNLSNYKKKQHTENQNNTNEKVPETLDIKKKSYPYTKPRDGHQKTLSNESKDTISQNDAKKEILYIYSMVDLGKKNLGFSTNLQTKKTTPQTKGTDVKMINREKDRLDPFSVDFSDIMKQSQKIKNLLAAPMDQTSSSFGNTNLSTNCDSNTDKLFKSSTMHILDTDLSPVARSNELVYSLKSLGSLNKISNTQNEVAQNLTLSEERGLSYNDTSMSSNSVDIYENLSLSKADLKRLQESSSATKKRSKSLSTEFEIADSQFVDSTASVNESKYGGFIDEQKNNPDESGVSLTDKSFTSATNTCNQLKFEKKTPEMQTKLLQQKHEDLVGEIKGINPHDKFMVAETTKVLSNSSPNGPGKNLGDTEEDVNRTNQQSSESSKIIERPTSFNKPDKNSNEAENKENLTDQTSIEHIKITENHFSSIINPVEVEKQVKDYDSIEDLDSTKKNPGANKEKLTKNGNVNHKFHNSNQGKKFKHRSIEITNDHEPLNEQTASLNYNQNPVNKNSKPESNLNHALDISSIICTNSHGCESQEELDSHFMRMYGHFFDFAKVDKSLPRVVLATDLAKKILRKGIPQYNYKYVPKSEADVQYNIIVCDDVLKEDRKIPEDSLFHEIVKGATGPNIDDSEGSNSDSIHKKILIEAIKSNDVQKTQEHKILSIERIPSRKFHANINKEGEYSENSSFNVIKDNRGEGRNFVNFQKQFPKNNRGEDSHTKYYKKDVLKYADQTNMFSDTKSYKLNKTLNKLIENGIDDAGLIFCKTHSESLESNLEKALSSENTPSTKILLNSKRTNLDQALRLGDREKLNSKKNSMNTDNIQMNSIDIPEGREKPHLTKFDIEKATKNLDNIQVNTINAIKGGNGDSSIKIPAGRKPNVHGNFLKPHIHRKRHNSFSVTLKHHEIVNKKNRALKSSQLFHNHVFSKADQNSATNHIYLHSSDLNPTAMSVHQNHCSDSSSFHSNNNLIESSKIQPSKIGSKDGERLDKKNTDHTYKDDINNEDKDSSNNDDRSISDSTTTDSTYFKQNMADHSSVLNETNMVENYSNSRIHEQREAKVQNGDGIVIQKDNIFYVADENIKDRMEDLETQAICLNGRIILPNGLSAGSCYTSSAVATEVPECSVIAANILRAGGNAVDAAVAATLCVGVVNSFSSGIGGGGFLLFVRGSDNFADTIDFREVAPRKATAELFLELSQGKKQVNHPNNNEPGLNEHSTPKISSESNSGDNNTILIGNHKNGNKGVENPKDLQNAAINSKFETNHSADEKESKNSGSDLLIKYKAQPTVNNPVNGLDSKNLTKNGSSNLKDSFSVDSETRTNQTYAKSLPKLDVSKVGGMAAGVPGEIAGLFAAHQAHGKLPWKELFTETIQLAKEFKASEQLHRRIKKLKKHIFADEGLKRIYTKNGDIIQPGDVIRRPEYARTLEIIQNDPRSFYEGEIAQKLVKTVQQAGGCMEMQDLMDYKALKREPLESDFMGYRVFTTGLPSSGCFMIHALHILEHFDVRELQRLGKKLASPRYNIKNQKLSDENKYTHKDNKNFQISSKTSKDNFKTNLERDENFKESMDFLKNRDINNDEESDTTSDDEQTREFPHFQLLVEIFKFIGAARGKVADPDFMDDWKKVVDEITSEAFAEEIAKKIDLNQTHQDDYYNPIDQKDDHGTTHINIIDKDGNSVSITSTVNLEFGAKVMCPETGIILNNQMDDFYIPGTKNAFDLEKLQINIVEPGKRPFSSAAPLVLKKNNEVIILGAAGGTRIPTSILSIIFHLLLGKSMEEAVKAPRIHHQFKPNIVYIEKTLKESIKQYLMKRGHKVEVSATNSIFTSVQGIHAVTMKNGDKIIQAVSDPRKGGLPDGY